MSHLVDELLGNRVHGDQAAGSRMLGDHEGAVGMGLHQRVPEPVPATHFPPA